MRKQFTKEIELSTALTILFTNNIPGGYYEFKITFEEVSRKVFFGKTNNKYWIHAELCPCYEYKSIDAFLCRLFNDSCMKFQGTDKQFHVWEMEE